MGEENTQGAGQRRSRTDKRLIRRAGRALCVGGRDRLRAVCGSDRSSERDGGPRPDRQLAAVLRTDLALLSTGAALVRLDHRVRL
jgi:hypothetical protein